MIAADRLGLGPGCSFPPCPPLYGCCTLHLAGPGRKRQPIVRCVTRSDSIRAAHYRATIGPSSGAGTLTPQPPVKDDCDRSGCSGIITHRTHTSLHTHTYTHTHIHTHMAITCCVLCAIFYKLVTLLVMPNEF